jgi:hypothetical protein
MSDPIARQLYEVNLVQSAAGDTVICRYFTLDKFRSLITQSGLSFYRVDSFEDKLEGKLPQSIWALQNDVGRKWYAKNRELVFVSCWQVNNAESADIWKEYAKNRGVLVFTTVDRLRTQLSFPVLPPPPPMPPEYAELARKPGVNAAGVCGACKEAWRERRAL